MLQIDTLQAGICTSGLCTLEAWSLARFGNKNYWEHKHPPLWSLNDHMSFESDEHRAKVMIPIINAYWYWEDMDHQAILERLRVATDSGQYAEYDSVIARLLTTHTVEQIAEIMINAANG